MRPADATRRWALGGLVALGVMAAWGAMPVQAHWDGYNPLAETPGQKLYTTRPPEIYYHNVGLLQLMVTNVGVVGNPQFVDSFGAGWQGGEYLYAAALWIGAVASDDLAYVSTGAYDFELRPSLDPVDTIYESFEGATGGDRRGFSASAGDDDSDGLIDEDFLNGKDDDGDGEIDEDYAGISQQMLSCEYWDYTEEAISRYPEHRPLYLNIQQNSFAWSTEGANNFVGLEYTIKNVGFEVLRDLYIGYFVDSDAGLKSAPDYYSDDGGELRSVDTTYVDQTITYVCQERISQDTQDCARQQLHLDIAFMHDTPGSETGGKSEDDPPAAADGYFGGMFLGHTTDPFGEVAPSRVQIHTCQFFSSGGTYPEGDPRNDFERYDLLSKGTKPRRPTSQPSDYRYCFSGGPFSELLPGEQLEFQVAFVIGTRWPGLLNNALNAQRIYNGRWRDVDGIKETGCDGNETCLAVVDPTAPLFWNDPCDSLAPVVGPIKNTECDRAQYWVDDDCNCCTPLQINATTCDGWETLVHWVGTVAPPPPAVTTEDPRLHVRVEGDRLVTVEWDNSSELVADPITGAILFCGYRIWRVEGWRRPIGSTGPTPEEWQLVVDLVQPAMRIDDEGDTTYIAARGSQLNLDHYTNWEAVPVDTLPSPTEPGATLLKYGVNRYKYVDDVGLKNGMLYFYDVTAYSCWYDTLARYNELGSQPAATESEGVRPRWSAVTGGDWRERVMVVPNPWRGGADWDLEPSDADPTGTHIDFANLPDQQCDVRIYTLSGDLVQTLTHDPGAYRSGTVRWNMISRNGQDITSGVYLYAVTCGGETEVGRFTVIR